MSAAAARPLSPFLTGLRDGLPFLLVAVPFGMLFGVVATEAGLDVLQTMVMSALVIAGASQFASLELLSDGAPAALAVLTGLAVNMRMAMYSASISRHIGKAGGLTKLIAAYFLVDQAYALSIRKFTEAPQMPLSDKIRYYFGVVAPICPVWYLSTFAGVKIGTAIPESFALDFAAPITFVAIAAPMLRGLPELAAAGTAIVLALLMAGLPMNAGLILAALGGMGVGALTETRLVRLRGAA